MHLSFPFTLIFKRKNVCISQLLLLLIYPHTCIPNCGPCWSKKMLRRIKRLYYYRMVKSSFMMLCGWFTPNSASFTQPSLRIQSRLYIYICMYIVLFNHCCHGLVLKWNRYMVGKLYKLVPPGSPLEKHGSPRVSPVATRQGTVCNGNSRRKGFRASVISCTAMDLRWSAHPHPESDPYGDGDIMEI